MSDLTSGDLTNPLGDSTDPLVNSAQDLTIISLIRFSDGWS